MKVEKSSHSPEAGTGSEPTLVEVPCPLCGADNCSIVHRETVRHFGEPLRMTVVGCRNCGMVYTNPRLADANACYSERAEQDMEHLRRYESFKQPVFLRALKRIRRFLPPPARLLDVGCGAGGFLLAAKSLGYEVSGIEPSEVDVKHAREKLGLSVQQATLESAKIEPASADVVTLWDVIEHVPDPRLAVRIAAKVLRPGGILAMRMPGATFHRLKSLMVRLTGLDWSVYSSNFHLSFFSPRTLKRLLIEEGFSDVEVGLTRAEAHARSALRNSARMVWWAAATVVKAALGVCLDNLEVYARRLE